MGTTACAAVCVSSCIDLIPSDDIDCKKGCGARQTTDSKSMQSRLDRAVQDSSALTALAKTSLGKSSAFVSFHQMGRNKEWLKILDANTKKAALPKPCTINNAVWVERNQHYLDSSDTNATYAAIQVQRHPHGGCAFPRDKKSAALAWSMVRNCQDLNVLQMYADAVTVCCNKQYTVEEYRGLYRDIGANANATSVGNLAWAALRASCVAHYEIIVGIIIDFQNIGEDFSARAPRNVVVTEADLTGVKIVKYENARNEGKKICDDAVALLRRTTGIDATALIPLPFRDLDSKSRASQTSSVDPKVGVPRDSISAEELLKRAIEQLSTKATVTHSTPSVPRTASNPVKLVSKPKVSASTDRTITEEEREKEERLISQMRMQREAEAEERLVRLEELHSIEIVGRCALAGCKVRLSRKVRNNEPRVWVECTSKCKYIYHYPGCWRSVTERRKPQWSHSDTCFTADCVGKLSAITTYDSDDLAHHLLKRSLPSTVTPIAASPSAAVHTPLDVGKLASVKIVVPVAPVVNEKAVEPTDVKSKSNVPIRTTQPSTKEYRASPTRLPSRSFGKSLVPVPLKLKTPHKAKATMHLDDFRQRVAHQSSEFVWPQSPVVVVPVAKIKIDMKTATFIPPRLSETLPVVDHKHDSKVIAVATSASTPLCTASVSVPIDDMVNPSPEGMPPPPSHPVSRAPC